MRSLRIIINCIAAVLCVWGGMYLLGQESYYLRPRWNTGQGSHFSGVSLYFLAASLFCFAALFAIIAQAWLRGVIPMPDPNEMYVHPSYKWQLLVRYWYLVIPAIALVLCAFAMS